MERIDGAAGGGAAVTAVATIAVTSPDRGHAVGFDLERRPEIVRLQPDVVGLHASEIPELSADLVEAVRRAALEQQVNRRAVLIRDLELAVGVRDLADEHDRAAMKEAGIRENGREVGRFARGRLRIADPRDDDERQARKGRKKSSVSSRALRSHYMTFFCADRARTTASARNSSAPAM